MRIAMVSEHASPLAAPGGPDSGGQNVHVAELAKALGDQGHEVTVWTRRDRPESAEVVPFAPGVTVRHVDAGPPRQICKDRLVPYVPAFAAELERAWTVQRPDVVHAHFWMSGLAAAAAAGRLGLPLVQTYHALGHVKRRHQGEADTSPQGRIAAERAVAAHADRIIATCADERFELIRLGASRDRIAVVPCGVDVDHFTPGTGIPDAEPEVPRLVSIGRLVRRKGVDELIRALSLVPRAELVVAGGPDPGGLDDDADVERLRKVAAEAGVTERVDFVGALPRSRVPALLRSADAAVCVPWYEPFGMVPLEAMACGVAVVASAVGGLVDTVVDGITGCHVEPRRPERLAATLRDLLDQPAVLQSMGVAGRDRAVSRYRWSHIARESVEVYRAAAERHAPVPADELRMVR